MHDYENCSYLRCMACEIAMFQIDENYSVLKM